MMKQSDIRQTSLNQTGIAVISLAPESSDNIKITPLFSLKPSEEADKLAKMIPNAVKVKDVFLTNNMLDYKIEDKVKAFVESENYIPESLVDEMALGIPFVVGVYPESTKKYYR